MLVSNDPEMGRGVFNGPPKSIRRDFVKKVYGTLFGQLALTAFIASPVATASDKWLEAHMHWLSLSLVLLMLLALYTHCTPQAMRRHPTNLLVLLGFTVCEAMLVGFSCAMYEVQSVVLTLEVSAAIVLALTIFAFNTRMDTLKLRGHLGAGALALFFVGLVGLVVRAPLLQMVYACGGALLFSAFLVVDTQWIARGGHPHCAFAGHIPATVDDYAVASLTVYLDVIRVFMFLLRIMGQRRGERR
mmetsp:Transcript_18562/g.49850  ORF Transcript_18562/g.49850 Transcript_18562/m.49850 type:complete len:245 (-) Transcript_18562:278-1012(-)